MGDAVKSARIPIYSKGADMTSTNVKSLLKDTSSIPTLVSVYLACGRKCAENVSRSVECLSGPSKRQLSVALHASRRLPA